MSSCLRTSSTRNVTCLIVAVVLSVVGPLVASASAASTPSKNVSSRTLAFASADNTYVVTFNANGGLGAPISMNYTVGDVGLTLPIPTLSGYTFIGWYSAVAGSTAESSPFIPASSLTLYALWSPDTYVVTFNANGGSVSPSTATYVVGDVGLKLPIPTRPSYTFSGWYFEASGGTVKNSPFSATGPVTLYAQWSPKGLRAPFGLTGKRVRRRISARWTRETQASSYSCTLLQSSTAPMTRSVTTKNNTCAFNGLNPTVKYGIRVVATNGLGTSRATTIFPAFK